ncbi:MAG TPA: hypothetical protein V6D17_12995 [Candidatus Obscuribacterales bacterium]
MFLKPRHFVEGLVVAPRDLLGGWRHLICRWKLSASLSSPGDYLERFAALGFPYTWLEDDNGNKICCHFCGHAIVKVDIDENWSCETCSAQCTENLLTGPRFAEWKAKLQAGRKQRDMVSDVAEHASK